MPKQTLEDRRKVRAAVKDKLKWLWNLEHRRVMDDNSKKGLVIYRLPTEYKGSVFRKLGIVPIYETEKYGTMQRYRLMRSKTGKSFHTWDLITMSECEARKLADAIYGMLGARDAPATVEVQPDRRNPPEQNRPMTEKEEIEMLMRKFRGA